VRKINTDAVDAIFQYLGDCMTIQLI